MNYIPDKIHYIVGIIVLFCILDKVVHKKNGIEYYVGILLLGIFMAEVYSLTGISPMSGFHADINLSVIQGEPLYTIKSMLREGATVYVIENIAGNILMFVPFGFLVPLLSVKMRHFFLAIPAGALLSICIEAWQLFLIRGTDIDDVILNTGGVLLGYILFFIFKHMFPKTCQRCVSVKRKGFDWIIAGTVAIPAIVIIVNGFIKIQEI